VSADGTITTVAGRRSAYGFAGDGGLATNALIAEAAGVAVGPAGNLFIADANNVRVRKVDLSGIITTVAGGGRPADGVGDGGLATRAQLVDPTSVAVDAMGSLFIADFLGQRIRKVDPSGIIRTVAGGGNPADGLGDGGLATDARLAGPIRIALDPNGNLYVADWSYGRVQKVSLDGKVSTVAGGGNPADGIGDGGAATDARLDGPVGVVVDVDSFITENHGVRIRKVSPSGIISTVAGNSKVGYAGDGGLATAALLNAPHGICLDGRGNLFFAEGNRYDVPSQPGGTPTFRNTPGNMVVREVIGVAVQR
jgi:sugar lactone lactonase YvrE